MVDTLVDPEGAVHPLDVVAGFQEGNGFDKLIDGKPLPALEPALHVGRPSIVAASGEDEFVLKALGEPTKVTRAQTSVDAWVKNRLAGAQADFLAPRLLFCGEGHELHQALCALVRSRIAFAPGFDVDDGSDQVGVERVNLAVLRDMIKDNPESMAQAARRWLGAKKSGEEGDKLSSDDS